jgi:single-stranded DNA-specific DHH superfamily exonuclease
MHPKLVEYFQRFQKEPPKKYDYFFTQLEGQAYLEKLPYVYGLEIFCLRLTKALLNKEKICIFSDYDTDAVTATAAMYWGLVDLGFQPENLSFYAPDRFGEGYGMNLEAVKQLAEVNDLIISVDCGINSVAEAEYLQNYPSCDLLITDHHHLHGPLPPALSIINPRLAKYFIDNPPELANLAKHWQHLAGSIEFYPTTNSSQTKSKDPNPHQAQAPEQIQAFYKSWFAKTFVSNPAKQPAQKFLSQSVTGVGVAWFALVWLNYFLQDLNHTLPHLPLTKPKVNRLNQLLSFVAIGTVADCQSILEPTNRLLVRTGLQILSKQNYPYPGLEQLMSQTGLREKISQGYLLNSQDLGFTLAPILNASGRLSHAKLSIQTLLAKSRDEAALLTQELIAINEERKNLVKKLTNGLNQIALEQVEAGHHLVWLEGDWNKGIIGLLASRFVNIYNLPCVVISTHDKQAVASLRAPEGYHLPQALKAAEELLDKFGGHPGAAGFSCLVSSLEPVKLKLAQELNLQAKQITAPQANYASHIPNLPEKLKEYSQLSHLVWLKSEEIEPSLLEKTWLLDPFGQDLPLPRFVFELRDYSVRWLGNGQNHLKLIFRQIGRAHV